ncbi:hypothetical protein Q3G72_030168 [Acer saccharum]|nr:hypothetical protein Q3G72_030168 [Acer saccharum]
MCRLERESGYYFDMTFFEEMVLDGNWEEAESYLSSFTKVEDNRLADHLQVTADISRLVYYNSGDGILALGSNGVHLRWKWPRDDDLNQSGQMKGN